MYVCVYVCMYVWLCMYDYVCMIMYVWLCMYDYVCMIMYVWLCMYDYVCMYNDRYMTHDVTWLKCKAALPGSNPTSLSRTYRLYSVAMKRFLFIWPKFATLSAVNHQHLPFCNQAAEITQFPFHHFTEGCLARHSLWLHCRAVALEIARPWDSGSHPPPTASLPNWLRETGPEARLAAKR